MGILRLKKDAHWIQNSKKDAHWTLQKDAHWTPLPTGAAAAAAEGGGGEKELGKQKCLVWRPLARQGRQHPRWATLAGGARLGGEQLATTVVQPTVQRTAARRNKTYQS